jgi:hypothetical protein
MGLKRLNDWFVQLARSAIASLRLFFSFIAVGKRFPAQPPLLQSVLSGSLLSAFAGRRKQTPPELDQAMRKMMPKDNDPLR